MKYLNVEVLRTGKDMRGDEITKELLEELCASSTSVWDFIPVTASFDVSMLIGAATNFRVMGDSLLCDLNILISDEFILEQCTPCVGYVKGPTHERKLCEIGMCAANVDPRIRSLKGQGAVVDEDNG